MALSGLAIAGIIVIVIGIIMAIIGIILLIVEASTTVPWYVWLLVIGGILLAIIGGIMLAIGLSEVPSCFQPQPMCPVPVITPQPVQKTCPYAQPAITIQPQYVPPVITPTPIITPAPIARPVVPGPIYSQRVEKLGDETFDPDPVTSVIDTPSTAVRRTANGPYGPNGENINITGVHKLPGTRTYTTRDIPEHPVTSNLTGDTVNYNAGVYTTPVISNF
jgi:hypothetical protein